MILRYILLCFSCCCLVSKVTAQSNHPLQQVWLTQLGSAEFDFGSGLVVDPQGNSYLTGYYYDTLMGQPTRGYADGFIAKYNAMGDLQWLHTFGGVDDDRPTGLAIDSSHSRLYLTGSFYQHLYWGSDSLQAIDLDDAFLLCIDSAGQWQWGQSYGGRNAQVATGLAVNRHQEIYLHGYFTDTLLLGAESIISMGLRDAFIVKVDSQGQPLWAEVMGGPRNDEALEIVFDAQDHVYLAGVYRDSADFGPYHFEAVYSYDGFLASWNSNGQWRWVKSFGGGYVDNCPALVYQKQLGRLVLGGWFFNDIQFEQQVLLASGEEESFMAAYDTLGQLLWTKRFGEEFAELIFDLATGPDDRIYAVGSFDSMIYMGNDTILAKHFNRPTDPFILGFESNGGYLWGFRTGEKRNEFGYHLSFVNANRIVMAGLFQDSTILGTDSLQAIGGYDVFLASYQIDTNLVEPTAIIFPNPPLSSWQLFPNPVEGRLYWSLSNTKIRWVRIYNAIGQVIWAEQAPSSNSVELSHLPEGKYWLEVELWEGGSAAKAFVKY